MSEAWQRARQEAEDLFCSLADLLHKSFPEDSPQYEAANEQFLAFEQEVLEGLEQVYLPPKKVGGHLRLVKGGEEDV